MLAMAQKTTAATPRAPVAKVAQKKGYGRKRTDTLIALAGPTSS